MSKEATARSAMKLALEALIQIRTPLRINTALDAYDVGRAITALREALTSVPDWASEAIEQPAPVQEPWGFHIQFNNGRDATFKGLDYLAECEAHQEAGETITLLYIKEKNT